MNTTECPHTRDLIAALKDCPGNAAWPEHILESPVFDQETTTKLDPFGDSDVAALTSRVILHQDITEQWNAYYDYDAFIQERLAKLAE